MILAAALLAASVRAEAAPAAQPAKFRPTITGNWQTPARGCSINLYFGSIGTGIDALSARNVRRLLEQDPAVLWVQPYLRGREGEVELCVKVRPSRATTRLFGDIKSVLPKRRSGAWVTVRTSSGLTFSNAQNR